MTVGHDEIDLRRSTSSDVLKDADPAIFALLGTGDASPTPLCFQSYPRPGR